MELRDTQPFVYIATPYSKYAEGIEAAWRDASIASARLIERGVRVYCPIAHTHPIAVHGGIDPYAHTIWLPVDKPFMDLAGAIVVVMMPGWQESYGIKHEIDVFMAAEKPVFYLSWPDLEVVDA